VNNCPFFEKNSADNSCVVLTACLALALSHRSCWQVLQLQEPVELATAAAKAAGIRECEATQAELATAVQAASQEVDGLTERLEVRGGWRCEVHAPAALGTCSRWSGGAQSTT
jgi:hypothetical protein